MGNKVTVIGFKGSGKTTYLTGMYIRMSTGVKNFSLLAKDPAKDLYLEKLWDMLTAGERPDPSDKAESYSFHIAHNYRPVCDFDWLDYPGGILSEPNSPYRNELEKDVKDSDCLLLIIDGDLFTGVETEETEEYKEEISAKFAYNKGIREEVKMFTRLSDEQVALPPIGIVVTKCDLIPKKFQETVREIIRESFSQVFDEPDRVIIQMSVSLGGEIKEGFIPKPFCVEQPIAFAVITILMKYLIVLHTKNIENKKYIDNHKGFFSGIINSGKINAARQNSEELSQAIDKWSADAYKLIELFSDKKIVYVGGKEKNLREYYKEAFRNIYN